MSESGLDFGLFVTGVGEAQFLQKLFQAFRNVGPFRFRVVRKIEQLSPRTSDKKNVNLTLPKTTKRLPTRDEALGLSVRGFLQEQTNRLALVVDDLEYARSDSASGCFERYRHAIDTIINDPAIRRRVSVHFFVMMLEAYFFADAEAVNRGLGKEVLTSDYTDDVEHIRHPKNQLKLLFQGYDEVRHGDMIIGRLDVEHVLSNPETCASLRTLFAWCVESILEFCPDFKNNFPDFQLDEGIQFPVTNGQLSVFKQDRSSVLKSSYDNL